MIKIVISVIIIVLSILYTFEYTETQTNEYLNKEEANLKGWIPSIIPASSYEIKETHNIDTNEIKGSFKYDDIDEKVFLNKLIYKNGFYIWKDFLFKIDKEKNEVLFFHNKE